MAEGVHDADAAKAAGQGTQQPEQGARLVTVHAQKAGERQGDKKFLGAGAGEQIFFKGVSHVRFQLTDAAGKVAGAQHEQIAGAAQYDSCGCKA